jgi:hypothetical protein
LDFDPELEGIFDGGVLFLDPLRACAIESIFPIALAAEKK